ncbi:MAG: hypothetical protein ACTSPX_06035, partial [Candidatus Thorarchaeota archaeon]
DEDTFPITLLAAALQAITWRGGEHQRLADDGVIPATGTTLVGHVHVLEFGTVDFDGTLQCAQICVRLVVHILAPLLSEDGNPRVGLDGYDHRITTNPAGPRPAITSRKLHYHGAVTDGIYNT